MDKLNRVVIVAVLLLLMVLCPLAVILPRQLANGFSYAAELINVNMDYYAQRGGLAQIGFTVARVFVALVIFLFFLLLIILELRRPRQRTVPVRSSDGGIAEVTVDAINDHLVYALDPLPDVIRVLPDVRAKGKGIQAAIYVETGPDVNVPEKIAEVRRVTREVIEGKLGLQLTREIQVVIKPVAEPKGRAHRKLRAKEPAEPVEPTEPETPSTPEIPTDWQETSGTEEM